MSLNMKTATGKQMLASLGGNVINGAEMQHYSTEERMVGYWIDGKPLYRKVVKGYVPDTTSGAYISGTIGDDISNVDSVTGMSGVILDITGNKAAPLPWITATVSHDRITASFNFSSNKITITNGSVSYNGFPVTIIIEYTKTTDTAITNNNTYSTDEQLTGQTWIDGKPIYRKCYILPQDVSIPPDTWTFVMTITDLNPVDFMVQSYISSSDDITKAALNYITLGFDINEGKIKVLHSRSTSVSLFKDSVIILEYTKTTD